MINDFSQYFRISALALIFFAIHNAANAAPVTWYLNNLKTEAGVSLSGSFDFDPTTGECSNVYVFGSIQATSSGCGQGGLYTEYYGDTNGFLRGFYLNYESLYFDASPRKATALRLFEIEPRLCPKQFCYIETRYSGYIWTAPDIPPGAIPLPAAMPLLVAGLGVIGFVGRRRRKTAA